MSIEEIKIIKKLKTNKKYYDFFETLVKDYSEYINTGAIKRDIGFTPHDFKHHCIDLYLILSKILPEKFYKKYSKGSNLFVLLTGVLFHDIIMAESSDAESRRKHSEDGKKWIEDEIFSNGDTSLKRNFEKELASALGDVILAHSDVKDEDGEIIRHTFLEVFDNNKDELKIVNEEEINVPYMAAVLRLADELDISYKRVEGTGYERKSNTDESRLHYEICKYFEPIKVSDHCIEIVVLNQEFERVPEEDKPTIAGYIIERYIKIKNEFDVLYSKVLSSNKFADGGIWNIDRIKLKDEQKYRDYLKKKLS